MSITTRAKTRPRAEAVVEALAAHADFASLIADNKLAVVYNPSPNGKAGLDTRLEKRVGRIQGLLVTVTPVGGTNAAKGSDTVTNDTRLAVNVWSRPTLPDAALPDAYDFLDEVQRVLAEMTLTYPASAGLSGNARPVKEQLRVGSWVEVADPVYLNLEIQVLCLVALGSSAS